MQIFKTINGRVLLIFLTRAINYFLNFILKLKNNKYNTFNGVKILKQKLDINKID